MSSALSKPVFQRGFLPPSPAAPAPAWWSYFLIGLFAGAVVWRMLALERLANGPFNHLLAADSEVYWSWASRIRSGSWIGTKPFFLGPLYPYWLALVRSFIGDAIPNILRLQILVGSAAIVLLTDATRRLATPSAAVIVGVVLAGYGMAVWFDLLVLMECLLFALFSFLIWIIVRTGLRFPIAIGTIVGLMALGRPTSLLLLIPCAVLAFRRSATRRSPTLLKLAAVPLVLMAVTALHHTRTANDWIPFTYSGGFNFFIGNGPEATGTAVPTTNAYTLPLATAADFEGPAQVDGRLYLLQTRGLDLTAAESAQYFYRSTLAHIRAHPGRSVRLFVRKVAMLFNHRELPQLIDAAVYDRLVGPLGWPLALEFAFFGVFGIVGIPVAWRRSDPTSRILVGWLVVSLLGTATFFVVDRYRFHLIPVLACLAGLSIAHIATLLKARSLRRLVPVFGLGVLACGFVFAPVVPYNSAFAEWTAATTLGEAWLAKERPEKALPALEMAVAMDEAGAVPGRDTPSARVSRAATYENLGIAYSLLGEYERALPRLAAAVALAPHSSATRMRLADHLAMKGAWEEAALLYETAGVSLTEAAGHLVRTAEWNYARGNVTAERRYLEAAVGLHPNDEAAVVALVRLEISAGATARASLRLRTAETNGLDARVVRAHRAWIRAVDGDTAIDSDAGEDLP